MADTRVGIGDLVEVRCVDLDAKPDICRVTKVFNDPQMSINASVIDPTTRRVLCAYSRIPHGTNSDGLAWTAIGRGVSRG